MLADIRPAVRRLYGQARFRLGMVAAASVLVTILCFRDVLTDSLSLALAFLCWILFVTILVQVRGKIDRLVRGEDVPVWQNGAWTARTMRAETHGRRSARGDSIRR